jgi:hypothetical protein
MVTAESPQRAVKMYAEGADYVFMPRILTAKHIISMMDTLMSGDANRLKMIRQEEIEALSQREEIIR